MKKKPLQTNYTIQLSLEEYLKYKKTLEYLKNCNSHLEWAINNDDAKLDPVKLSQTLKHIQNHIDVLKNYVK